ncbi:MAG: DUF1559 domain-containing protein [Lentisphaeria bacterium]|nr:DUF1559 domain-containing protein [Lentisphaeria bacterium]NQZ67096.1 DUF1559 domain-containing protein [Lentisphaeria bacterium]
MKTLSILFIAFFIQSASLVAQDKETGVAKTSFQEVTKELDPDGNFYAYISAKQIIEGIDKFIKLLETTLVDNLPVKDPRIGEAVRILKAMYEESGLREISGLGASSKELKKGFYRNTFFMHHYPNAKGKMWKFFGDEKNDLSAIKIFPENTVMAQYGTVNVPLFLNWIEDKLTSSRDPKISAIWDQMNIMSTMMGLPADKILGSLAGRMGYIVTLDKKNLVTMGDESKNIKIPEPGFSFIVETKNTDLYDMVTTFIKIKNPKAKAMNGPVGKMLILEKTKNGNFEMSPVLAQVGNYFIISSHPKHVNRIRLTKDGKLKNITTSANFKKAMAGIELKGDQLIYLSEEVLTTLKDAAEKLPKIDEGNKMNKAVQENLMGMLDSPVFLAGVVDVRNDGILFKMNSSFHGIQAVAIPAAVAPMAIVAGMALPVLSKAREKARRVNCNANLKQIGLALLMYSGDQNGTFPPDLGSLNELEIMNVSKVYVCPSSKKMIVPQNTADLRKGVGGYVYVKGLRDDNTNATTTILAYDKPENHPGGQWMNFLFVDGHVEGIGASSIEDALKKRSNWIVKGLNDKKPVGPLKP